MQNTGVKGKFLEKIAIEDKCEFKICRVSKDSNQQRRQVQPIRRQRLCKVR